MVEPQVSTSRNVGRVGATVLEAAPAGGPQATQFTGATALDAPIWPLTERPADG